METSTEQETLPASHEQPHQHGQAPRVDELVGGLEQHIQQFRDFYARFEQDRQDLQDQREALEADQAALHEQQKQLEARAQELQEQEQAQEAERHVLAGEREELHQAWASVDKVQGAQRDLLDALDHERQRLAGILNQNDDQADESRAAA